MTRDEATKLITDSLGTPPNGSVLADNHAFAQRLAAALDALGLIGDHAQQQSPDAAVTHHQVSPDGQVSTPHPMTESRHGITPGPTAADASWRRQPTPDDTSGAA